MSMRPIVCLYSTYKELKLLTTSFTSFCNLSLYSTYKELKQATRGSRKENNNRLYSTYKELKRSKDMETIVEVFQVYIVPIRN